MTRVRMRKGWDEQAGRWGRFAQPGRDRYYEQVNLPTLGDLLPPPGRRTLDLGCGEGRVTRVLASRGHSVIGTDSSPAMVALTRGHQGAPPAVAGDAAALPFMAGQFDLVVAFMCRLGRGYRRRPSDLHSEHRPLAAYTGALERAGFLLEAVREPRPPAGFAAADPGAGRWFRIPLCLHIRAVKPGR
jgi:SAM-dependent methyltransferase